MSAVRRVTPRRVETEGNLIENRDISELNEATQRRGWREVGHVMEHSDISSKVNDAARRRDWREVGHLMESGQLSEEQRSQAVEAASHCAGEQDLAAFIVPVLTEGELLRVLKTLFTRHCWSAVCKVLKEQVSYTLVIHILTEALHLDDDYVLRKHILPMFDSGQVDLFMTHLATTGQWGYVLRLLGSVGRRRSTWRVGDIQIDGNLFDRVAWGDWGDVGYMLRRGVSDPQRRWAISVACQRVDDWRMTRYVLPSCTSDQFEDLLTVLVRRRLWQSVGTLLGRARSPAQHRWALHEACQQADDGSLVCYILPHCADHQLDDVLTTIVTRELWRSVDMVLHRIVSPTQHRWAMHEACQKANKDNFRRYILPHCTDDQLDGVLNTLVKQGLWWSVNDVLDRGVSTTKQAWAIHEAVRRADDLNIAYCIVPHCTDDQLDDALVTLVTRGLWVCVDRVLHRIVCPATHRRAVQEACQQAEEKNIKKYILPHCADDQRDDVLTTLVTRGLWETVGRVLSCVVSKPKHK